MSTILKAQQEMERRGEPGTPNAGAVGAPRDRKRWAAVLAAVLAAGGGTALIFRLFAHPPSPGSSEHRVPVSVPQPLAVAPQAPPALGAPAARAEPPWARVEKSKLDAPPAFPPAAPAEPPRRAALPKPPPPAQAAEIVERAPLAAAGEPRVELKSIAYGAAPEARTVTLRIEGAVPVTLRQGQSTNGIEVQLILRDSVYLRSGGTVFSVALGR